MSLIWILFIVILSVAGLAMQITLLLRLKRRHREIWIRLGEPMTLWHYGPRHHRAVTEFYWSAEHRTLDDQLLTALVFTTRVLTVCFCLLILGLVTVLFTG